MASFGRVDKASENPWTEMIRYGSGFVSQRCLVDGLTTPRYGKRSWMVFL